MQAAKLKLLAAGSKPLQWEYQLVYVVAASLYTHLPFMAAFVLDTCGALSWSTIWPLSIGKRLHCFRRVAPQPQRQHPRKRWWLSDVWY